tara:strand:- start:940 stop:1272 length:333 start_codon:yes stop_codon:yes gene_type:complete
MAVIDFSRLISFKQWFDRTNQLGSNTGDPAVINADLGSNLVNAVNVVHTDLGNKAALNTDVTTDLVEAMNDLNNSIGRFRLNEGEPQAYDMHPQAVFGTDSDFDAHGMVE